MAKHRATHKRNMTEAFRDMTADERKTAFARLVVMLARKGYDRWQMRQGLSWGEVLQPKR